MTPYFLDTNILLDFLGNREGFGPFALRIFEKGLKNKWKLWTSDNSILTAYYILSKEIGEEKARQKIAKLLNFLDDQPVQKSDIQAALSSQFKDLEDGVQHFCALNIAGLAGIITRNKKDFQPSQIPVFEPWDIL
ncbi:PIN domain nuclease [Algoriphagus jejuensis]|uniref:PIN domain nuclease n=1 Tax=Algoriphagus jejuensis TaxID=419934 RepID=A0ABP3YCN0_9BACT